MAFFDKYPALDESQEQLLPISFNESRRFAVVPVLPAEFYCNNKMMLGGLAAKPSQSVRVGQKASYR